MCLDKVYIYAHAHERAQETWMEGVFGHQIRARRGGLLFEELQGLADGSWGFLSVDECYDDQKGYFDTCWEERKFGRLAFSLQSVVSGRETCFLGV